MSTLTNENAAALATMLSDRISTKYSDDLVAVLGTGYESTNAAATLSWLLACLDPADYSTAGEFALAATDRLNVHLDDVRSEATRRVNVEVTVQHPNLPSYALSEPERRLAAKAVYWLITSPESEDYMKALICFVLDGKGDAIERIARWIRSQSPLYTFYPTELTIPLSQRLMYKLRQEGESL